MAKRGISISVKLIGVSTLLVVLVIGVFGVINSMQSRRIIDDSSNRLRDRIVEGLRQAGLAQLLLFAESTRVALQQSDYTTLQATIETMARQDERITEVVVIQPDGKVMAHSDRKSAEKPYRGPLQEAITKGTATGTMMTAQKLMVFATPVRQDNNLLCTVALAYTLSPLFVELEKAARQKGIEVGRSLRNTLVVGLISVFLGVVLAVLQGFSISRPIQAVVKRVNQIAGGDFKARVEIHSHDEIGLLGDRFNYMAERVLILMQETQKKAVMEKELEVASAIQACLVPEHTVFQLEGLSIASFFKPATQCGGDWWNYFLMPDGRILIIIGDVTGHGVASAMITAAAKGAATTMMTVTNGKLELKPLLIAMNAAIHDSAKGRFVMTSFASIYNPKTRTLSFANAGHNFPYLYQAQSNNLISLVVRGNRLGDLTDSEFEVKEVQVNKGDTVFWYTDGVVECEDVRGEEFGERRFRNLLREYGALEPEQSRDKILGRARQFWGDVPAKDDITFVVGKFV